MHLPLYKALRAINISEEAATDLVTAMDSHIEARVSAANQALLATLTAMRAEQKADTTAMNAKQDAAARLLDEVGKRIERNTSTWRWLVGLLFGVPATVVATVGALKALGVI